MAGIGLQLVAEPEDEVVHGARQRRIRVTPHQVQQLVPRHDVADPLGQAVQDLELPVGELHAFGAAVRLQPLEVDDRIAEPQVSMGGLVRRRTA